MCVTLGAQIGKGSFGTVNRIRRKSDGRIMVCKEITYGKMSDKEKQMLVSEVNILRELKHPNIVRYYDRFVVSSDCFYICHPDKALPQGHQQRDHKNLDHHGVLRAR